MDKIWDRKSFEKHRMTTQNRQKVER